MRITTRQDRFKCQDQVYGLVLSGQQGTSFPDALTEDLVCGMKTLS